MNLSAKQARALGLVDFAKEPKKKLSRKEELELKVSRQLSMANIPPWETQLRFKPPRLWRFDFAWPEHMVALEVNGGTFMSGKNKHTNGARLHGEYEKLNAAQTLGWVVLQCDAKHVSKGEVVTFVFDALAARGAIKAQVGVGEFALKR